MRFPAWLKGLLIGLMVVGVVFRFVNLNHKVYWHDEVYTTLRAAGYTRGAIDEALFQNRVVSVATLQTYQRIKPGSTPLDTIRSLAVEDPQHPPLYFLMTRAWMQLFDRPLTVLFKSSLTTQRSLPALISVLALPAMYGLAWELFASAPIALLATTLLALSPFDVLFAQTARQYSLLTLMVILSSFCLLRAMRGLQAAYPQRVGAKPPRLWWLWGGYTLAVAIGLYAHPFFALTLVGHGVYVAGVGYWNPQRVVRPKALWLWFGGAIAGALLLYSPWVMVMAFNRQRALATTDWSQVVPGLGYLLKLWILSFTSLFFDLDFGFNNPWTMGLRLPIVMLIGLAFYELCRRTAMTTWLFVVTAIAVPFLLLALPDLLIGGKRSAVSRYLISCYPSLQLAVAYCLGRHLALRRVYRERSPRLRTALSRPIRWLIGVWRSPWLWRGVLATVVLGSLLSLTVSAASNSWWNRDLSYFNDRTAELVNGKSAPIVVSDIGADFTNTGDLISLSYRLKPTVELLLLQSPEFVATPEFQSALAGKDAIAFRPSQPLQQRLEQVYGSLPNVLEGERLFAIARR